MEMSGIYEEGSLILTCNRIRTSKRFLNCNGFSRTPPTPLCCPGQYLFNLGDVPNPRLRRGIPSHPMGRTPEPQWAV
jgi:hypothetical protein